MTKAGAQLIEAATEALAVARGEVSAARIWHNGWPYVPAPATRDETIIAVAVLLEGDVWQLPAPARHHHVLWALDQVHPGRAIEAHEQGFMTNTGRYVTRQEAAMIAKLSGQVSDLRAAPNLYSEDLW